MLACTAAAASVLFTVSLSVVSSERQTFTIHISTWNVNGKSPPGDLSNLLGQVDEYDQAKPDLVVAGFQEVASKVYQVVASDTYADQWSKSVADSLGQHYDRVKTAKMLGVVMDIYLLRSHKWSLRDVEAFRVMTGFGGHFGNKGAVVVNFGLYGKKFSFVNAHLPAHDDRLNQRLDDFHTIETRRRKHCSSPIDYAFWLGDLNFRLSDVNSLGPNQIQHMIQKGQTRELLEKDQLKLAMKTGQAFVDWTEGDVSFKPTYKIIHGTNNYNLKRRPAWTDRILSKSESGSDIVRADYRAVDGYLQSDHRPVSANFKIEIETDFNNF